VACGPREAAGGQAGRDQRAALDVVQRQLAVADLAGFAAVDHQLGVNLGVTEHVQVDAALRVDVVVADRRDQGVVERARVEGVAHVEVVGTTAHALETDQTGAHARVGAPAVEAATHRTRGADAGDGVGADGVDGHAVRTRAADRVALGLAGQGVNEVAAAPLAHHAIGAGAAVVGVAARPVALTQRHRGQFVELVGGQETRVVADPAARDGEIAAVGAAVLGARDRGVQRDRIQILLGDDVDHTSHGVRAVDGRSAVLQHLDAVNDRIRQGVQVGRADRAARARGRQATAVEQHQRARRRKATQADGVGTGAAIGDEATVGIVDLALAARHAGALQHLGGGGEAGQRGVFIANDLHRRGGAEVVALDARARGHDDRIELLGRLGFGLGGGGLRSDRLGSGGLSQEQGRDGQRHRLVNRIAKGLHGTHWVAKQRKRPSSDAAAQRCERTRIRPEENRNPRC
jgi:hypothetical protein